MATPSITVITCYYKVKSKHSFEDYSQWIKNLLLTIQCNIIIFTPAEQAESLTRLAMQNRKHLDANKNVKIIVKELEELEIVKRYPDIWEDQYRKDPTSNIRTKECYMIWNSKLALVREAILLNPFGSDKFVWNDIGSLRDVRFIQENYISLIKYPLYKNISRDKLDIVLIEDFKVPNQVIFKNEVHLSGAIFGGGRDAFLKFIDLFYQNFEMYLEKGYFIGCDQQILATCYKQHPELFNLIIPDYSERVIDKWFYLYYHYSQPRVQE
jgi:hypothetical protein